MRRVVITGIGIVSSIGNNIKEVLFSLKKGKSGISYSKEFKNFNLKSCVWGKIKYTKNFFIDKKFLRFMNNSSIYAYICMKNAILDSKLTIKHISNLKTGLIVGSSIGSPKDDIFFFAKKKKIRNRFISPYLIIKSMFSGISACLATCFNIKGINYSITSACSSSAHCIGNAIDIIKSGKQNIVFAGGGDELCCETACKFDIINVLSRRYNDIPKKSSRAFDVKRDGFVLSEGAGIIVIEELEHALKRNATIYGEFIGYGSASDGLDMISPSGIGLITAMKIASKKVLKKIDYLNAHGTSTIIGDLKELWAIKKFFGNNHPEFSSTKSMTGHSLGASGVHELIYSLIMLKYNFIAPSININKMDSLYNKMNIVKKYKKKDLRIIMTNSCGFGGTNVSLIIKKYKY